MNKIAKKLFSAAVIVCLSISSVAAYAAQITPSSTSITLGKNDKEISDDIRKRLSDCAKSITDIDYEMEDIHNEVFGHHKI